MKITRKRKADEDQQERPEKKTRSEQDARGVKRSTDDWESYTEELRACAERRAEANERTKVEDVVEGDAMMEAIGAGDFSESDLKYNEVVEKLINQLCGETFGEFCDVIAEEVSDSELIKQARQRRKRRRSKNTGCARWSGWKSVGVLRGRPL